MSRVKPEEIANVICGANLLDYTGRTCNLRAYHDGDCQFVSPVRDQPPPIPHCCDNDACVCDQGDCSCIGANAYPAIAELVIADLRERMRVGKERYGTLLQPHNGRDPLVDAYQEALDLAQYLRQAIEERA